MRGKEFIQKNLLTLIVFGIIILMWFGLLVFYYLKADEVTKDPCSICAKYMGDDVSCTLMGGRIPIVRVYYKNGSIYDAPLNLSTEIPSLDPSLLKPVPP